MEGNLDENMNPIDDFDYEKIQQILEEEEKNRLIRKDKQKQRDKDKERKKKRSRSKTKSISIERKKPSGHKRRSKSRSRERRRDDKGREYSRSKRSRSKDRRRDKERDYKEKAIVEKNIEEARRQALEAQRDDCTILVYRLHLNAKERDLFNFFAGANIGKVIDIKVIRDPRSGKSKGVAYVEFESRESAMLAVALAGQQVCGQSIAIQLSQAEKNRQAAASKFKKEAIKDQQRTNSKKEISDDPDGAMKIYVGGLTDLLDVTDSDLRAIFSPFGEIEQIDMPKDPVTLKPRGYCFVMFRRASQGHAAIAAMNGFKFKGKSLKVGVTHEYSKQHPNFINELNSYREGMHMNEGDDEHLQGIQNKQLLMMKLNRDLGNLNLGMLPSGMNTGMTPVANYSGNLGTTDTGGSIQTACVLLANLFDPGQVNLIEEPNFYSDTKQDVFEECSNYGRVDGVWVDQHSQGNVWVKFANNNWQAARAAIGQLNGRWFASRPIIAQLIPENIFEDKISHLK